MTMTGTIEERVTRAVEGDAAALESVLREIRDDVYGLALRMLGHPTDAEDVSQEALIRIATQLAKFEGRSKFRTWAYRVAVRSILNAQRSRVEHGLSFEQYGEDLLAGQRPPPAALSEPERERLRSEVKIACTLAMLMCLDRDHRMAYVLGEIFGLSSAEAADILEIRSAALRKRLSRARARVQAFTSARCGLVGADAPCSCSSRIAPALELGRIDAQNLLFTAHPLAEAQPAEAAAVATLIASACDAATLMRSNPRFAAPERLLNPLTLLRPR